MVIEDHSFMTKLADEQILFLDLLFERQCTLKLFLCRFQLGLCFSGRLLRSLELFSEVLELGLRVLDNLTELLLTCCADD